MSKLVPVKQNQSKGRLFPQYSIPSEELAKRQTEDEVFYQRCQAIFDRVYPQLVSEYYGWFIVIEPDSGNYFIDPHDEIAFNQARQKYPDARLMVMGLNEQGTAGSI